MDAAVDKEAQLVNHVREALSQSLAATPGIGSLRAGPVAVNPSALLDALRGEHVTDASETHVLLADALADDVTSNALVNIRVRLHFPGPGGYTLLYLAPSHSLTGRVPRPVSPRGPTSVAAKRGPPTACHRRRGRPTQCCYFEARIAGRQRDTVRPRETAPLRPVGSCRSAPCRGRRRL